MTMLPGTRGTPPRAAAGTNFLPTLLRNLGAGCRLALGLHRPRFEPAVGQLLALLALGWSFAVFGDWRDVEGPASLSSSGLAAQAARSYWWLAVLALLSVLNGGRATFLRLATACAAAEPLLWLGWFATLAAIPLLAPADEAYWQAVAWWGVFAWQVLVLARWLWMEADRPRWRVPLSAALYAAALQAGFEYVPDATLFVSRASSADTPPLDVEGLYYSQAERLDAELEALAPGRSGLPDFYFLGFGAYAGEGVFRREVRQVRDIVARRFDADSRAVLLVNSRLTLSSHPLANRSNLDYVLRHLGRRMETGQDILFLFMTSHGRETGELVVDFGELGLNDLEPAHLRRMLDDAGIGWRVIVVSACYSGAFVPALEGPRTLVITAAAHDRSSFGCAHENRWTYFGEAFFRDALASGKSLTESFELAQAAIAARESREGREPSLPQMSAGAEFAAHFARWEAGR